MSVLDNKNNTILDNYEIKGSNLPEQPSTWIQGKVWKTNGIGIELSKLIDDAECFTVFLKLQKLEPGKS